MDTNSLLLLALGAALGYLFANKGIFKKKKKAAPEPSAKELAEIKRRLREEENFWNYTGDEQTTDNR